MGMGSDNVEVVSFAEQKEMEKHRMELEASKKTEAHFVPFTKMTFDDDKTYMIYRGPDKHLYKAAFDYAEKFDEKNNSPEREFWCDEKIQLTNDELTQLGYA